MLLYITIVNTDYQESLAFIFDVYCADFFLDWDWHVPCYTYKIELESSPKSTTKQRLHGT